MSLLDVVLNLKHIIAADVAPREMADSTFKKWRINLVLMPQWGQAEDIGFVVAVADVS